MRKNHYEEIVAKSTAYIKENLGKPLSIPEVCRHAGFSLRHVRNAFRKILGQNIVQVIQTERISKAKSLLQLTQLDITQVALESGFENLSHFSKVFRSNAGFTPSAFRREVLLLKEVPPLEIYGAETERGDWFSDLFSTGKVERPWKPISGDWRVEKGTMFSAGDVNRIGLDRPLPENGRISFQVCSAPLPHMSVSNITLWLMDESDSRTFCAFSLPSGRKDAGEMRFFRGDRRWSGAVSLLQDRWHDIVLEIRDDTLRLNLDGTDLFSFRDSFPVAYSGRCHLHLGAWYCTLRIRKFTIANLGFLPMTRPIRQGDALYNAGLPAKAMEFYLRLLGSGSIGDAETMELRHKIGMCYLRQNIFSSAQNWFEKVVVLREDRFWAQQGRLALLELYWKTLDLANFNELLGQCITDPSTRDGARIAAQFAVAHFDSRGLFSEAIKILDDWSRMEPPEGYAFLVAQSLMAEDLQRIRRFADAESVLLNLIRSTPLPGAGFYSRIDLMQLYHEWGRIDESERVRAQIELETRDPFQLVRCSIQQASNLRARERFEEALMVFEEISKKHSRVESRLQSHIRIQAAHILCCLGRLQEGRRALDEARQVDPNRFLNSGHALPFHLVERDFAVAAEAVLRDYRNSRELVSASAELGVKAGILHDLDGKEDEAKSLFKEVSQRFPDEQVRFFGTLARALSAGEELDIFQMNYEHFRRSEMFYLLGLLMEKRKDKEKARALFEQSLQEDPSFRWPAFFAKRKYSESEF